MGFHTVDGELVTDGSLEDEIIYLCEAYPGMKVCVGNIRRASTAVVYFFSALGETNRRKFNNALDGNRWIIHFDNGSTIQFLSFCQGTQSAYPEPPVHIFLAYRIKNNNIIRNMCMGLRPYEGKLNHWHKNLFPMFYDQPKLDKAGYLFTGDEFYEEFERVKEKVEFQKDVLGQEVYYRPDAGYSPDITSYDSAVAISSTSEERIRALEREIEALKNN